MPATDLIRSDVLAWLLEPENPGVRYLALRDLCDLPAGNPELESARRLAHQHGQIASVLDAMQPEGYWEKPGPGYGPKYKSTVWAMIMLGQMGASARHDERVAQACAYMLEHSLQPGGQMSYNGKPYGTFDCLQGNLIWSLRAMGVDDPRLQAAYEWTARTITGEGLAPKSERKETMRYSQYKCGPLFACGANYGQPCAWGGVKVMLAFGLCPPEWRSPLVERAITAGIDFLLDNHPAEAGYPNGENPKPSSSWWKFGFPTFYVTDILQIAEAAAGLGYAHDPRLAEALRLIESKQDEQGRWKLEYRYGPKTHGDFGRGGSPNKWVTLRALRVLKAGL